jgi:hypothetical protein
LRYDGRFQGSETKIRGLRVAAPEVFDRAVVGALRFWRKITGRQFPIAAMVLDTFTTDAFARARFVSAIAPFHVPDFVFAIHGQNLPLRKLFPLDEVKNSWENDLILS